MLKSFELQTVGDIMVFGTIKDNPHSPFSYEEEVPSWEFFHQGQPIPLLGRLYDRGAIFEEVSGESVKLPDLYLAKKQRQPENGIGVWASIEYTARELESGKSKYESYDGNPLAYYISNEKKFMWLQDTEIDVVITQKHLAQHSLERWDND